MSSAITEATDGCCLFWLTFCPKAKATLEL